MGVTTTPVSKRRRLGRGVGGALRAGRGLSLWSRFLLALLAVIVVAETAIAVTFYDQQKQHSITEELVSLGRRMHDIADFQLEVARLVVRPSPVPRIPPAVRDLEPRVQSLLRVRARFDRLPSGSPAAETAHGRLIAGVRELMLATRPLHAAIDARIAAAERNAEARQKNALWTVLGASGISLLAAIALALVAAEFNRMAEQLQHARATLEQRVRRRTAELAEANRELDVRRADQERLAQQRRMLLNRVIGAQEEERGRIARELHDETNQSLTALGLGLEAAMEERRSGAGRSLDRRLEGLARVAGDASEELERLVLDLRPAQLDHLGLLATLRWYVARVDSKSGLTTRLNVRGKSKRLRPEVETALFRIAQEALTNVARHAQASQVEVELNFERDQLSLEVRDDGVGFDAHATTIAPTSLGLVGMRERAHFVDGTLVVRSGAGDGTFLRVTVPREGERR